MKNVSVVGNGMPAIPPELTEDTEFNLSTEENRFAVLSSPAWSRKWTIGGTSSDYSGYDFPASDGTNPYKYYVVEVDANGDPLNVGEETEDGFKIAEEDRRRRGPGEMSGTRQSGLPDLRFVNVITDFRMFEAARDDAAQILSGEISGCQALIKRAEKEKGDIGLA